MRKLTSSFLDYNKTILFLIKIIKLFFLFVIKI
jgi:hypothetical protein